MEKLLERIEALEERVDELEQENERLRDENKRLKARLRWYEGPHTPSSQQQSDPAESSFSDGEDDDESPRTDGGTPGRKQGYDPEWRSPPDPDEEIEITCDCCPECGEGFDESLGVSPRLAEELPDPEPPQTTQYNRHCYECDACGAATVASHPDCPDEGQFGVNVLSQIALSRFEYRLPHRKFTDCLEQLHGLELSGASA